MFNWGVQLAATARHSKQMAGDMKDGGLCLFSPAGRANETGPKPSAPKKPYSPHKLSCRGRAVLLLPGDSQLKQVLAGKGFMSADEKLCNFRLCLLPEDAMLLLRHQNRDLSLNEDD